MPHSSLHEFSCPSSVIFCLEQATQLFATFTETGVTCSASPRKHDGSSGFSHVQTPNCRDGHDAPRPSTSASPAPLRKPFPTLQVDSFHEPWYPLESAGSGSVVVIDNSMKAARKPRRPFPANVLYAIRTAVKYPVCIGGVTL